jgi:hypothetical protein
MDIYRISGLMLFVIGLIWVASAVSETMPNANEYAYGWTIVPSQSADFYEVLLPLEVNQSSADESLRDVGVYNHADAPVPRTITQPATERRVTEQRTPLVLLPLHIGQVEQPEDLKLLVQRNAAQTTVTLDASHQLAELTEPKASLTAYIVDVRKLEQPIYRLALAWPESVEAFIGHLDIHGSNDLANWQLVGSGSIASLRQDDVKIDQRSIDIEADAHDFLRLTWRGVSADWFLTGLEGLHRTEGEDSMQKSLVLAPVERDEADSGYIFDTHGHISVDQISLLLPSDNTTVRAHIFAWSSHREQWQKVHSGVFYHLRGGGDAVSSPPATVARQRTDRWKVVIDQGQSELDLKLELGWRPDKLVFVAQGSGPYRLVAGRAADALAGFPQQVNYGDSAILALAHDSEYAASARLSPRIELAGPAQLQIPFRPDWTRWLIWIALAAGVSLVGYMAASLIRQLKGP